MFKSCVSFCFSFLSPFFQPFFACFFLTAVKSASSSSSNTSDCWLGRWAGIGAAKRKGEGCLPRRGLWLVRPLNWLDDTPHSEWSGHLNAKGISASVRLGLSWLFCVRDAVEVVAVVAAVAVNAASDIVALKGNLWWVPEIKNLWRRQKSLDFVCRQCET